MSINELRVEQVSYSEASKFSQEHVDRIMPEPTAISSTQLFHDLDPEKLKNLSSGNTQQKYGFLLLVGDQPIGWHLARQRSITLDMESTGILESYQGKGYYRALVDQVIKFATKEGFAVINSVHSATNNQVIIPKLKAGFLIKGFEINLMYGLDVKLSYYLNETQRNAHAFRVGSKSEP